MPLVALLTPISSASRLGSISKLTGYQDEWQAAGAWTWLRGAWRARLKIHSCPEKRDQSNQVLSHLCDRQKWQTAYLSPESRYHCRCRRFSACWSSPSEPWFADGWGCPGAWCRQPPLGYSAGWSGRPFGLRESTFTTRHIRYVIIFDRLLAERTSQCMSI